MKQVYGKETNELFPPVFPCPPVPLVTPNRQINPLPTPTLTPIKSASANADRMPPMILADLRSTPELFVVPDLLPFTHFDPQL
jgi:hypothetical protein